MTIPLPPPDRKPRVPRRRSRLDTFVARLRRGLLNELHTGTRLPGDRLPSIRQIADEHQVDHRLVSKAYRVLQRESLVEVRERSGVYISKAAPRRKEVEKQAEISQWMARVLAEAWQQDLTSERFHALVRTCTDGSRLRCACVESNVDQMTAYCFELAKLSGLTTVPLFVSHASGTLLPDESESLEAILDDVDLVVTTHFHAPAVRALVGGRDLPVLVLRVNPELVEAVRRHLATHPLTVIACTPEFGDRFRQMYADVLRSPDQLTIIMADRSAEIRRLDPSEPVVLTRAAKERCRSLPRGPLLFPHSPTIAGESLREISDVMVRLNLGASAASS